MKKSRTLITLPRDFRLHFQKKKKKNEYTDSRLELPSEFWAQHPLLLHICNGNQRCRKHGQRTRDTLKWDYLSFAIFQLWQLARHKDILSCDTSNIRNVNNARDWFLVWKRNRSQNFLTTTTPSSSLLFSLRSFLLSPSHTHLIRMSHHYMVIWAQSFCA